MEIEPILGFYVMVKYGILAKKQSTILENGRYRACNEMDFNFK